MLNILVVSFLLAIVAPAPVAATESVPAALDHYLREQVELGFSGAVLITRGGRTLLHGTYGIPGYDGGLIDPGDAHSDSIVREPAFWIGSISKQFTAAAILKLTEQGRMSIHDRLPGFFDAVPSKKRDIGVHHLLTHTSGLEQRYAADGITDRVRAVRALLKTKRKWPIGAEYHYSNDGYNLLAAIVEVAGDQPFEVYMKREILKPAGMTHSGFWGDEGELAGTIAPAANPKRANRVGKTIYKNGSSQPNYGYRGATGIFSTTGDLDRWITALRAGLVLSNESLGLMFTPHVITRLGRAVDSAYGYGIRVQVRKGQRVSVQHAGDEDWLGHSGVLKCTEEGDVTIVLSNAGDRDGTSWSVVAFRGLAAIADR